MKKIFFILSAALLMVGCEDFLDTRILTEKTSENFPLTEEEADEVLTGIYAHLLFESPETSSMFYFAQLAGVVDAPLSQSNISKCDLILLAIYANYWYTIVTIPL